MQTLPGFELARVAWRVAGLTSFEARSVTDDSRLFVLHSDFDAGAADPVARLAQVHAILDAPELVFEPAGEDADEAVAGRYVWEDVRPLEDVLNRGGLTLGDAITLARQAALILDALHRHDGVHGALSVRSILWSESARRVRFADLSYAVLPQLAPLRHPEREHREVLLCQAPEVRSRSLEAGSQVEGDLYSLGVILYRLLVGHPPFDAASPVALMHEHLAMTPPSPSDLDPELPAVLSRIVMRLLAKVPEHRYRSARALAGDLQRCLDALEAGQIHDGVTLSEREAPSRFRLPSVLFGRADAIARLEGAYALRRQSGRGLVLVRGLSGVGKTALADTLRRQTVLDGGVFAEGKFPQQQSNQPFVGVVAAIHDVVRYLLGLPQDELEKQRSALLADLGSRLSLITDLVPELEVAIGRELSRPEPPPGKEHEWLVDACRRFLRQFAVARAPLVLFVDDVHWMDAGSQALLASLLDDALLENFLMVLAYRTQEAEESEVLQAFLKSPREVETVALDLDPLDRGDVTALLRETFVVTDPSLEKLAAELYGKTGGNPLFIRRLLESLHHGGQLRFDASRGLWSWDEEVVRASEVSENVVDFLVSRLQAYDPSTLELLQFLSCIGGRHSLSTLSEVSGLSQDVCAGIMATPLADGTVVRTVSGADESIYAFSHDRLEQATYSLVDDRRRSESHLKIATALMARQRRTSTTAFQIATQLDRAGEVAVAALPAEQLGERYLDAAEQARYNAAYDASRRYVERARQFLSDDAWDAAHDLTLRLNRLHAELRYQEQDFPGSRRLLHRAIARCEDPLQRADLYALLITQATIDGAHDEAIIDGRSALQSLGFELPFSGFEEALTRGMRELDAVDVGAEFDRLLNLPVCLDENVGKIMDVLMVLIPPTFFLEPALNNLIAVLMTRLTLEHGVCRASPKGLVNYGTAIVERGRYREGFLFGELAVQLAEKHGFNNVKPRVLYTYAGGLNHWVNPLQSTPTIVDRGRALCTELGERDYEGYILTLGRCQNEVFLGQPIAPFREQVREIITLVTEVKNDLGRGLAVATHLCLAHLAGETDGPESFDTDEFTEAGLLAATHESRTQLVDCFFFTMKAHNLYLLGRHDAAALSAGRAMQHMDRLAAPMGLAVLPLLVALIAVERALATDDRAAREAARGALDDAQRKHKTWAAICPHNFAHFEALLEGARARLEGRLHDAVAHFSEAVARAANSGFVQFEGMAHQNLARTWREVPNDYYQAVHLLEARRCFRAWGALRLLPALDGPTLPVDRAPAGQGRDPSLAGFASEVAAAESMALVSRMGRLSAETEDLERLSKELTEIIVQASGATRAVLLMRRVERLEPVHGFEMAAGKGLSGIPAHPTALVHQAARMCRTFVVEAGVVLDETLADPYLMQTTPASALCLPLLHRGVVEGVLYVENRNTAMDLSPGRRSLIGVLAAQAALSIRNALLHEDRERAIEERTRELSRENARLNELAAARKREIATLGRLRRFLSPRVAEIVERDGGWERLAKGRQDIAVVFCDLRDFSEFASWSQPEQQQRLQNEYRRCLDELFVEHDATVDHWEGDGAMVFVGAPEPLEPPTAAIPRAVALALSMREAVQALVESWGRLDVSPRGFGVGITYGTCWVGLSGEGWRVDYNAGGAYVNLASRLCAAAGPGEILITNAVRSHLDAGTEVYAVGNGELRGIGNPGEIFRI